MHDVLLKISVRIRKIFLQYIETGYGFRFLQSVGLGIKSLNLMLDYKENKCYQKIYETS